MFRLRTRTAKPVAQTQPLTAVGAPAGVWRARLWPENRIGRVWRIGAAILAACGAAAAIAPWTVSRGALREEIAAQLRSSSGLYVFTEGNSTFSLLPRPHVTLERISFVEPRATMVIKAERLSGQVRLLPLLAGRLELYRAELLHPQLTIDIDGKPMTTAGAVVRAADARPASPEAARADRARLGIIAFVDGGAVLRRGGQEVDALEHINATLDWRTVSSPAALDGEATWRGQRGSVALWVARPSELLRGETSQVTMQIKAPALDLSANGTAAAGQRPQFDGRLVAATGSLREIVRILHGAAPLPLTLGPAALDARASASLKGLDLANVRLKLDGSDFEGALSWRNEDARPLLSGTLATSTLDLDNIFRYLPPFIDRDGHFSRDSIVWRDPHAFDIDLRLSASKATYQRMQALDVAGAVLLRDGRLEGSLADATMYKGSIKARLVVAPSDKDGLEFKANLQARGVDWSALGWDRFGEAHLGGIANIELAVDGAGTSLDQMARSLKGRADVDLAKGDIGGIDVERALRRIATKPLASALDIHSGRTPFDTARLSADIAGGAATVTDGIVKGEGYAINLSGASQIAERQVALHAIVSSTDAGGQPRADGAGFAFDVQGQWDNPAIIPDARSLIRRSGAARPLLTPRKPAEPAE